MNAIEEARERANQLGLKAVGKEVYIFPLAKIVKPEVVSIGDHVIIDDYVLFMGGRESTLGSYIHIASFTSVSGGGVLEAENFTTISSGCRILTGTDDFHGEALTGPTVPEEYRKLTRTFVKLEKHSILGANVVVLPGVTIGEGAAVGAGSLVLADLEPWTINVGVPAKPVKKRPSDSILEMERKLLEGP